LHNEFILTNNVVRCIRDVIPRPVLTIFFAYVIFLRTESTATGLMFAVGEDIGGGDRLKNICFWR